MSDPISGNFRKTRAAGITGPIWEAVPAKASENLSFHTPAPNLRRGSNLRSEGGMSTDVSRLEIPRAGTLEVLIHPIVVFRAAGIPNHLPLRRPPRFARRVDGIL